MSKKIDFDLINIQSFDPEDIKVHLLIKEIGSNLESQYSNEYDKCYMKMLQKDILRKVYIIFYKQIPIGLRVLRIANGNDFNTNDLVLRTTMFRILSNFRNYGIGTYVFKAINNLIFDEYSLDILYSESKEFGGLKLYSRFQNIKFFEDQYTNNILFSKEILESKLPNNFMFENDIKFEIYKHT
jgi:hypothetical protein